MDHKFPNIIKTKGFKKKKLKLLWTRKHVHSKIHKFSKFA